jgi:hypothetical protein
VTGLWVVLGTIAFALLLVGIGNVLNRVRGIDEDDKWSGWYRGKTHDVSQTLGYKAGEYDSMDDHGNRDMDGGLR